MKRKGKYKTEMLVVLMKCYFTSISDKVWSIMREKKVLQCKFIYTCINHVAVILLKFSFCEASLIFINFFQTDHKTALSNTVACMNILLGFSLWSWLTNLYMCLLQGTRQAALCPLALPHNMIITQVQGWPSRQWLPVSTLEWLFPCS